MAVIQASFYSQSLIRSVNFNAIIPVDKMLFPNRPVGDTPKTFKTLYLLHGVTMNHNDWLYATRILNWAEEKGVAVIMPAGENKFFLNNISGDKHEDFLGVELIKATRQLFPLSAKREDTFIAGLSMGGYGAIRTGLKYPETFSYIAGLSSALIQDRLKNAESGRSWRFNEDISFGDNGEDKDPKALISAILEAKKNMPEIFISCGTEDGLIASNRELHEFLLAENVEHTYIEEPGRHDWDFWDRHIYKVLEWLPL